MEQESKGVSRKPIIRNLILSLTGKCNYKCVYCYASCHPEQEMTVETALRAADMAGKSGRPFILQFTGGEPLFAFHVLKAVTEYVEQKSYPAILQLQTNCSLMTSEIADYLKEHNIAVGVSLDGRPPVNDSLRKKKDGNSASEATIRGIRLLVAKKIPIGLTCVVTEANVKSLPGIVQMAFYLGNVRQIGFDLLRIVQALYEGLSRQDNGPYRQRPCKRSPPHLVKADDDGIGAPTGKLAFEFVQARKPICLRAL